MRYIQHNPVSGDCVRHRFQKIVEAPQPPRESFDLIRVLLKKRGLEIPDTEFAGLESRIPLLLTPGAAETLTVKIYRQVRTSPSNPVEALRICLTDYQNPVPLETLDFQIRLAVSEASDLEFVPPRFPYRRKKLVAVKTSGISAEFLAQGPAQVSIPTSSGQTQF